MSRTRNPMQIAQNEGRWYRVDMRQMRYFPMRKAAAELALATGEATETAYLPFGRGDLWHAYMATQKAIAKVSA